MYSRIYKNLLNEYEQMQVRGEMELIERREQLYELYPRLEEIRQHIANLYVEGTLSKLRNDKSYDEQSFKEDITVYEKEKLEILLSAGIDDAYLKVQYNCEKCRDTGFINENICACFKKRLVEATSKETGIDYEKQNFDSFNPLLFPAAQIQGRNISQREYTINIKNKLKEYIHKYPLNENKTILFTGKTGLGKTFLLNSMGKALIDKDRSVFRIGAYQLYDELFNASMTDFREKNTLLKRLTNADVLLLDDLGTEVQRNNFNIETLFYIINERNQKNIHTFISTNLDLNELRQRYSDRITSRLFDRENTMIFRFLGRDIRLL